MKKVLLYVFNLLKGLLMGFICVAAPGVSGGTIAVIIGLFTDIIMYGNELLHNWFKKSWWKAFSVFACIGIGVLIGAFLGSKAISITYEKFPLAVTLLLMGFIIGSFPMIYRNIKGFYKSWSNDLLFVLIFAGALVYTYCLKSSSSNPLENMNVWSYIGLVVMGIVAVATMIVPGISGSIFLMAFGYYIPLTNVLSNVTSLPLKETLPILLPFMAGCIIGAVLVIKVIKWLLDKFFVKTNVGIFAFVVASPIMMVKLCLLDNESLVYNTIELIVGIVLFIVGFIVSFIIGRINAKKEEENKKEEAIDNKEIES